MSDLAPGFPCLAQGFDPAAGDKNLWPSQPLAFVACGHKTRSNPLRDANAFLLGNGGDNGNHSVAEDAAGTVPINTLYTEPQTLFAQPLSALSASGSKLMTVGVNHDTLLVVGWLDLSSGPQVLHVPDFSGRYYSVQFTDPFNIDFAYVGTRETGTRAGGHLITGPGWIGEVPTGMRQISSQNNSVLVLGRILVYSDSDLSTAYDLAKQIQLAPLSNHQP